MTTSGDGRVWGLEPYLDYWIAQRWMRATSGFFSAVQIPAFVASEFTDPGVAPDARVQYVLVARYGNIAIWQVQNIRLTLVKPSIVLPGCGVYDWGTINWDLTEYSETLSWNCDPLCDLASMYIESSGPLLFMTVKPELPPHIPASEGWEYVVAIGDVSASTDPQDYARILLGVHQPDYAAFGGVTPTDFFHTINTATALKPPWKGDKLV